MCNVINRRKAGWAGLSVSDALKSYCLRSGCGRSCVRMSLNVVGGFGHRTARSVPCDPPASEPASQIHCGYLGPWMTRDYMYLHEPVSSAPAL